MGRIGERFARLRSRGEKALVAFVTAGDPDLATTEALVQALAASGADVIEIGVPFSDPIAEGPTIQRASERALAGGASLRKVLQLVKALRPKVDVPLVLMGYANVFLAMGEEGFVKAAAEVGVDGTIVHAEMSFGNGVIMLGSAKPDRSWVSPLELPALHQVVSVVVDDPDGHYAMAKAAGARIVRELRDEDYGSRGYGARDPEGNEWYFGTYRPGGYWTQ